MSSSQSHPEEQNDDQQQSTNSNQNSAALSSPSTQPAPPSLHHLSIDAVVAVENGNASKDTRDSIESVSTLDANEDTEEEETDDLHTPSNFREEEYDNDPNRPISHPEVVLRVDNEHADAQHQRQHEYPSSPASSTTTCNQSSDHRQHNYSVALTMPISSSGLQLPSSAMSPINSPRIPSPLTRVHSRYSTQSSSDNSQDEYRLSHSYQVDSDSTDSLLSPFSVFTGRATTTRPPSNSPPRTITRSPLSSNNLLVAAKTRFDEVPLDALTHILSYLPSSYIIPASKVSKSVNESAKHNIIWKPIFSERPFMAISKNRVIEDIENGHYDDFLVEQGLWKQKQNEYYSKFLVCAKLSHDLQLESRLMNRKVRSMEKIQNRSRFCYAGIGPILLWALLFLCTVSLSVITDFKSIPRWLKWLLFIPMCLLLLVYLCISCGIVVDPLLGSFVINRMRLKFRSRIGFVKRKERLVRSDVVGCTHHFVFGNVWIIALLFGFLACPLLGGEDASYVQWFIPVYAVTLLNIIVPFFGLVYRYMVAGERASQLRFAFVLYAWNVALNMLVCMQVLLVGLKLDGRLKNVPMGGVLSPVWACIALWLMICPLMCCFSPISCFISPDMSLLSCYLGCIAGGLSCIFSPVIVSLILFVVRFDVNVDQFYLLFCFIPLWLFMTTACSMTLCTVWASRRSFWN